MPFIKSSHKPIQILKSALDNSVNYVFESKQEARFVQRSQDEVIVYLSTHNGCNKSCRFCHLTQSGQTSFEESSIDDLCMQAMTAIHTYKRTEENNAKTLHFNFMARGEPLASSVIQKQWHALSNHLVGIGKSYGFDTIKLKISTIIPEEVTDLISIFPVGCIQPEIYYSFYSIDSEFRKRWMPKSSPWQKSLFLLSAWQSETGGRVVVHNAFIKGENDVISSESLKHYYLHQFGIKYDYNIVRYNPFSTESSMEVDADSLIHLYDTAKNLMQGQGNLQIIDRVGYDTSCSCGMFVNLKGTNSK